MSRGRTRIQTSISVSPRATAEQPRPGTERAQRREVSRSDVLAQVAKSRRVYNAVVGRPCTEHDASVGVGCWEIPSGIVVGKTFTAVCDARIAAWAAAQHGLNREVATGRASRPSAVPRGFLDPERVVLDRLADRRHPNRHPATPTKAPVSPPKGVARR